MSITQLQATNWIHGPAFLTQEATGVLTYIPSQPEVDDREVRKKAFVFTINHQENAVSRLLTSHSNWFKLRRSVAWILAIKDVLQGRSTPIKMMTCHFMKEAEKAIIRYVQQEEFHEEIKAIKSNEPLKVSSKLIKLKPIMKDNILLVGGRLNNSCLHEGIKHPTILPHTHVTLLLVEHVHQHSGC